MRTYRGREALIIAGAFFFALFGSSVRVFFPLGPFLPADYFLALMIFLGFTCRETELFALCQLAALFRDILFGCFLGPSLLLGLFIAALSPLLFARSWDQPIVLLFPKAILLFFGTRVLEALIFMLLPQDRPLRLSQRLLEAGRESLLALPGLLFALLMEVLIFYFLLKRLRQQEKENELKAEGGGLLG